MADIELTTDATVPASATLDITVNEDTNQDGTADNTASQSIDDGNNTHTLSGFTGGTGNDYWLDISIDQTDETVTASLNSATVDTEPPGIGASVETISADEPSVTITADATLNVSTGAITAAEPSASVFEPTTISASVETISADEPAVSATTTLNVSVEAISADEPGVSLVEPTNETLTATVEAISTTEPAAALFAEKQTTIDNSTVSDKAGTVIEITEWDVQPASIAITWRVEASELSTLRTYKDRAGDVARVVDSDGGWLALDRSNDDNSFQIKPPDALRPPLSTRTGIVESYSERGEPSGTSYRVTVRFVPETPRDLDGTAASATASADEWLFEFSNGDIATQYVERLDEGNQGDIVLGMALTPAEAEVVMESATYTDAVSVEQVPDGNDFVRDNNSNNRNTVTITRPTNLSSYFLPDEGDYAVRSWRARRTNATNWQVRLTARKL